MVNSEGAEVSSFRVVEMVVGFPILCKISAIMDCHEGNKMTESFDRWWRYKEILGN